MANYIKQDINTDRCFYYYYLGIRSKSKRIRKKARKICKCQLDIFHSELFKS